MSKREKVRPAKGESFVWLSSLGLALGLLMVAGILLLIVSKGLRAFWPRQVWEFRVDPGSEFDLGKTGVIGGEVTEIRHREEHTPTGIVTHEEWLVYVANRDHFQFSFKWVDVAAIHERTMPPNIMKLERRNDPVALGTPTQLRLEDGSVLPFADPTFATRLDTLMATAAERRATIKSIEKGQIGPISSQIERYKLRIRNLTANAEKAGKAVDQSAIDEYQALIDAKQVAYEALRTEAQQLREQVDRDQLDMTLANGDTISVPLGDAIYYSYPNRLSTLGRVGLMMRNLWNFVSAEPREANTEGGIFPAIFGTFILTVLMSAAVMPLGVVTAIYLHEYARQGPVVRAVRIAINNLAGVPSIVFGVFGLGFFVYFVGSGIDEWLFSDRLPTPTFGTSGLLWASLTLALLTVPVVVVASEEALSAVPRGAREGSLALGASKWQTIWRVVLPASAPGILTGLILAMARGAGEVAPLMLVGAVKIAPTLPLNNLYPYVHLDQKFMHLGFHIYDLGFQSPDSQAAIPMVFATTLLLILLVVAMNLTGIIVREKLRRKYKSHTF